ncbi:glycosyltransferase family 1 protein [Hyphomonas sp. GM-8P]|uniref:glycosyltransferase family 4 protein n=1 Tax=Hyphomonas sp. GM-8P TaxID=1280945 RepID=UPI000DC01A76|nr:glycosyltransferase family 1 protein [Hyphomonas sp. GM-8P]RAN37914.1 hypothetical protein HY26_04235 [Hyphomonas sp. GM-8P]
MKLWIDGQCFQTSSRNRGIGRYAFELLQTIINEHSDVEVHISLNAEMAEEAIAARDALSISLPNSQIHTWHSLATGGEAAQGYTAERRLSEIALVHHVNCIGPDVALSLSPFEGVGDASVPLLPHDALSAPLLGIFYDAIPARYRQEYLTFEALAQAFDRRMAACRDFSDLLCISEFALHEARELLGTDNGINISAGVSHELEALLKSIPKRSASRGRDKIVYVGALDWRKNVSIIPKALSLLPETTRRSIDFVMAGDHPSDQLQPIKDLWKSLDLDPIALKTIGHVSDRELVELYRAASVVIQPSFMEGFGLTALEAILCGTPVVAARAGALPEVVGMDHLLFDPNSPQSLAEAIGNVIGNPDVEVDIAGRRQIVSKQFNWSNSARLSVDLLKKYAQKATTAPDVTALRKKVLPAIKSFDGQMEAISETLSLAEPPYRDSKRLIVDATATIRTQFKTGIQRVVRNICNQLPAAGKDSGYDISISFADDLSGRYRAQSDLLKAPDKSEDNKITPRADDSILMLDSSWDIALLHRPYLIDARVRGANVISCLYDTVPLKMPAFTVPLMPPVFRDWLLSALSVSTGFVCISKAVADEFHSLLEDINYPHLMKIGYWRLGADFMTLDGARDTRANVKSLTPSFLMVGTLEPRKGHAVALDAFELAWQAGHDAQLTIVGQFGWGAEALVDRIENHPELGRRLRWYNRMEDEELIRLYMQCDALIAASYAEGFGLPIVEAGRFGAPIIASDIPVFREVTAGAPDAHFFDVGSAQSLFEVVRQFLRDHSNAPRKAPATLPDWPDWAESTHELLDVILSENWYKTYEPISAKRFCLPGRIGKTSEEKVIEFDNRAHDLRIVDGPVLTSTDSDLLFSVAVTNKSNCTWFGKGDAEGRFGVALSYHVIGKDGLVLSYENPRSPIVLALHPGDTHFLPVTIPSKWLEKGAEKIELELVQEGVSWWGNGIMASLQHIDKKQDAKTLRPSK